MCLLESQLETEIHPFSDSPPPGVSKLFRGPLCQRPHWPWRRGQRFAPYIGSLSAVLQKLCNSLSFVLRMVIFGMGPSNLMQLKAQAQKLSQLRILFSKPVSALGIKKVSLWRSAPNFTECPLGFLGSILDSCKHTKSSLIPHEN